MYLSRVRKKVFVGMSGGVDSSVAALLLKKEGYDVTGVFMRCYNIDGCAEHDAEDARRVAEQLEIPFYIFDFEKEYKREVVQYMIEGYKKGITPNPDVMCNKEIKFGLFLKRARELGADYISTGHYVTLKAITTRKVVGVPTKQAGKIKNSKFSLWQAKDLNKDQSYFLWTLTQKQLQYCLFPIGDYMKSEVREIAKRAGLVTAEKKDSQGICFLGNVNVAEFLKKHIRIKKGNIITLRGKIIGTHEGAELYTIGQRHGFDVQMKNKFLGVRGNKKTPAHYVVKKDIKKNEVVVAEENDPALFKKEVKLKNVNFLFFIPHNAFPISVYVRIRYRQSLVKAKLIIKNKKIYTLLFSIPVQFVSTGQSAVFYKSSGEMVGGGVIC